MLPKMLHVQKNLEMDLEKSLDEQEDSIDRTVWTKDRLAMVKKLVNLPDWYISWYLIAGFLSLLISAFYLFASIRLLQVKQSAISLFYFAVGGSIFITLVKNLVGILSETFITGILPLFCSFFGIVVHLVLIIVVATGNKEAFQKQKA